MVTLKDEESPGQPKKMEDAQLETILEKDSWQTQEEPANVLGVDHSTVAKRLKAMGMISK